MAGMCFLVSGFISDLGRDKRTMLGRLSWAWLFPCTLLISAANDLLFNFTGEGLFHKKQKKKKKEERGEKLHPGEVETSAHDYPSVPHEKTSVKHPARVFYIRAA